MRSFFTVYFTILWSTDFEIASRKCTAQAFHLEQKTYACGGAVWRVGKDDLNSTPVADDQIAASIIYPCLSHHGDEQRL